MKTVAIMNPNPIISIGINTVSRKTAEQIVAISGSTHPNIFPRAGPTRLVPFRNIVNASTVPTSTISAVIATVAQSNCTDIFHTRMIKKNAIPPVSMPIPVGIILPQSASSC